MSVSAPSSGEGFASPVVVAGVSAQMSDTELIDEAQLVALLRAGVLTNGHVDPAGVSKIVAVQQQRQQYSDIQWIMELIEPQINREVQLIMQALTSEGLERLRQTHGCESVVDMTRILQDRVRAKIERVVTHMPDIRVAELARQTMRTTVAAALSFTRERSSLGK